MVMGTLESIGPPEALKGGIKYHSDIQKSIYKNWISLNNTAYLEFEVPNKGDGRRGFIDIALVDKDRLISVEIDRAIPKKKSINKCSLDYFNASVFILRSSHISVNRKKLIEEKLKIFNKPFMIILISDNMVINRLNDDFNNVNIFFRNWLVNYRETLKTIIQRDERPIVK